MTLFVFGINHNTAPVRVREQLAFAPESTPQALQRLVAETPLQETTPLSTRNRTEIYGYMPVGQNAEHETGLALASFLSSFPSLPFSSFPLPSYTLNARKT